MRSRARVAAFAAVAAAWMLAASPPARADGRLDELSKRATAQYQAGDYSGAVVTLLQCYDLQHDPRFLYNIARAYEKAHQPVDAARFYHAYLDQLDTEAALVARAKEALERLEPKPVESETRLPPVVPYEPPSAGGAAPTPPAGTPVPPPTAPANAGTPPAAGTPPPPKPPPPKPAVGEPPPPPEAETETRSYTGVYVLIGAGAAVTIVGAGFGFWANGTANEMHASLDPVEKPKLRTETIQRAILADATMGVGVAAMGTGLILRIALPRSTARVGVGVGPGSVAVSFPLEGFW